MKYYLCLKCGEEPNHEHICQNCGNNLNDDDALLDYANECYYFGYMYRLEYELQVKTHGEVRVKYSLIDPDNVWQLLAAFALSGVVGNLVYDSFKIIGNKLIEILKRDKPDKELRRFIEIVSDDEKLKELFGYIQAYYFGMPDSDERVRDAVFEEKMVDVITSQLPIDDFIEILESKEGTSREEFAELLSHKLLDAIKSTKNKDNHIELPSKERLNQVLINLKK